MKASSGSSCHIKNLFSFLSVCKQAAFFLKYLFSSTTWSSFFVLSYHSYFKYIFCLSTPLFYLISIIFHHSHSTLFFNFYFVYFWSYFYSLLYSCFSNCCFFKMSSVLFLFSSFSVLGIPCVSAFVSSTTCNTISLVFWPYKLC